MASLRQDAETVSIHAPARGATFACPSRYAVNLAFQSTRPRGARLGVNVQTLTSFGGFNPRAREGRDMRLHAPTCLLFCFNPRAREGRD